MHPLSSPPAWLYARAATARRAWYARHPEARRRLSRPVVSVGNLAVGGSAKTPTVRHVARVLAGMGERPAILSRGYARARPTDGVVVVSDGDRIRADLDRAGDEPLMLARSLPGVGVFVSPDRYLAGCLAERCFGATVHVLDDGFQHFRLARSVDLLLVTGDDVREERTLPFGRLREPWSAARAADAIIAVEADPRVDEQDVKRAGLEGRPFFRLARQLGAARPLAGGQEIAPGRGRALLMAGVARPDRLRADVERAGWTLAGEMVFGDHQRFVEKDLARIGSAARAAGADIVLTTEKDLVRLRRFRPVPMLVAWVPLHVTVEPADVFQGWLAERLAAARAR
jgi:tetraacyldisaccharide 4'-kinase